MQPYPKILITGGSGMLGQHLRQEIPLSLSPSRQQLNLENYDHIIHYLQHHKPDIIIHAAAKVGGIADNIAHPYSFFEKNIIINTHIIKAAINCKIPRLLAISSTCAYPDVLVRYPIKEQDLHLGPPAASNLSYGYSKRTMCVHIDAANQQLGTKYNYIFPCNLYSEFDSITTANKNKMHFITALLYKIVQAERSNENFIELFGSGQPLRQFMYAGDLAKIIKLAIDKDFCVNFNVAPDNSNLSIDYMANHILEILHKTHISIRYNADKPDGQYRKDVCNDLMKQTIGNFNFSSFNDNIPRIYNNYVKFMATENKKKTNTVSC